MHQTFRPKYMYDTQVRKRRGGTTPVEKQTGRGRCERYSAEGANGHKRVVSNVEVRPSEHLLAEFIHKLFLALQLGATPQHHPCSELDLIRRCDRRTEFRPSPHRTAVEPQPTPAE